MYLNERVKADEGYNPYPYRCSQGVLTIGYGRNIDKEHGGGGISEDEASFMLRNDLGDAELDLRKIFEKWADFGIVRQSALVNMRFQLGPGGFRSFKRMIWQIRHGNWQLAAREAMDSLWASQTPERAWRIAEELRSGIDLTR